VKIRLIVLGGLILQTPQLLAMDSFSYSGRLINNNGSPVTGEVNLKFDLSSTQDSSDILCSKTISEVPLSHGIFNVKLDFLPADCENNSIQTIMESIPSGHSLSYQVTDLTNSRSYSHQTIYSVPSSFMASFAKSLGSMGATSDGQVLKWSAAAGKWIPGTAGTGNGTITSINTGPGLVGGPIENNGTISIAPGGIEDGHLAPGINPSKLSGTRDASKYLKGDNTWSSFEADLLATILNGFSLPTPASAITSSDSVLEAFGKLQGQITALESNKLSRTGGTLFVGTINGVPTPTQLDQIVNKEYVDSLVNDVNPSQWITATPNIHYDIGNVGIGTATPGSKLSIVGDISLAGGIKFKPNTYTVELKTSDATSSDLQFILPPDKGSSGEVIVTDGNGNLSWASPAASKQDAFTVSSPLAYDSGTDILSIGLMPTSLGGTGLNNPGLSGNLLKSDGLNWYSWTPNFLTSEADPTVLPFAKASLPTCGVGEVLKSDGSSFSCVTDANTILSTDDVSLETSGSTIRVKAQGILDTHLSGISSSCGIGQILVTNGMGSFSCATDSVVIGGSLASSSAILDLQSTTKGLLPPRMTTTERDAITAPSNGLVIYNTSSNQIEFFNGTGWSTSNTFVGTRATSDIVQAGSLADTKLNLNAKTFDVGNNFDLATDRFQPTVAGKYLVTLQIHASSQSNGDHNISAIYKNGSMYERRFTRSISAGNSESTIVTLVDMNGSTDFIEPYFSLSAGNAVAVTFTASLQSPGSSSGSGGGAVTSDSVDGTHIQDGTITSADIAPNTVSVSNLDFASNEGINLPQQAANPATGTAGQTYFNTTTKTLMFHDGTSWQAVGSGGGGGGSGSIKTDSWDSGSNAINTQSITLDTASVVVISASIEAVHSNGVMEFNGARANISVNGAMCGIDQDYVGADTNRTINASASCIVNLPAGTHTLKSETTGNNIQSRNYNKLSYVAIPTSISGGGGADNLGNHTATQNLNLGANWISGDGDNEGLSVSSNGKVGIGLTTPTQAFEVNGAAKTVGRMYVSGDTGSAMSVPTLVLRYDTANNYGEIFARDYSTGTQKNLVLQGIGGYVGIGTITPSTKLDVVGDIKASGDICSAGGSTCMSTLASGSTKWSLNGSDIYRNSKVGIGTASPLSQFHIANGVNAIMRLDSGPGLASSILHYNGATAGSGLAFFPAADGRLLSVLGSDLINNNAKLTILQNGNVGIGTITPSVKLDVVGNIKASGDICSAGGATCMSTLASGSSKWSLNGSDIYRNSKVGVGTSTPGAKLHLVANDSSTQLRLEGTGTYNAWMEYRPSDVGAENWNTGVDVNGFKIHNQTDNTTRLLIDNSGNVGIGTNNPPHKLTVQGNHLITTNDYVHGVIGSALWLARGAATGNTHSLIQAYHDGAMTYAPLALNPSGGNVGIGTTEPDSKLHINTSGNTAADGITLRNGTNQTHKWYLPSNTHSEFLIGSTAGLFSWKNSNGELLRINSNGNVGIGTISPVAKLQVEHPMNNGASKYSWTSGAGLFINNPSFANGGEVAKIVMNTASGGYNSGAIIHVEGAGAHNSGQLVFSTGWDAAGNGTERMRIKNNGNVGVGTTAPTAKIHAEINETGSGFKLTDSEAPNGFLSIGEAGSAANTFAPMIMGRPSGSDKMTGLYSDVLSAEDVGSVPALILLGSKASGGLTTRPVLGINNHTTRLMTVRANGTVGIGTSAPSQLLHISGAGSPSIRLEDTDDNRHAMLRMDNSVFEIWSAGAATDAGVIVFRHGQWGRDRKNAP